MDTDYITVDPNPMMATDDCTVNWKIKPKPAKPTAKKAAPNVGFCKGDVCKWPTCDGCMTVPNPPPSPPLDVPAIRKTRVIHPKGTCWGEGQQAVCAMQKDDTEDYWDCEDRDAYSLQISVSQKNARCVRIVP